MAQNPLGLPDPPSNVIDVAAEAKRLTDRLLDAEQYLALLPWKVEAEVSQGDVWLRFERRDRGWVLACRESRLARSRGPLPNESDQDYEQMVPAERRWADCLLRDASVRSKAIAAELLPKLMATMREEYDNRIANLKAGNAALDAFEKSVSSDWALSLIVRTPMKGLGEVFTVPKAPRAVFNPIVKVTRSKEGK
jgi:hypothetical protein